MVENKQQSTQKQSSLAQSQKKSGGGCCGGGSSNSNNQKKQSASQKTNDLTISSMNSATTKVNQRANRRKNRGEFGSDLQNDPNRLIEAKIVLLGDSGVGKSSIAQRFCHDTFDDSHDVTIGGAYLQKKVSIPGITDSNGAEQQAKLHIWDTGGHEKFRSMISLYYRDAVGAIICYDISDPNSFQSVDYWVKEMHNNTTADSGGFVMALVGNKVDLPADQHKISSQMSQEFAKQHKMIWGEVSAKTGQGLNNLFGKVAEKTALIKKAEQGQF